MERCDFDCSDSFDLTELAPEGVAEFAASYGGLQVETEQRNFFGHVTAMR